MSHFFNLSYFARDRLDIHQEIDLTLREILKQKRKPTLIRLSNKASARYVFETSCPGYRITNGPKYHLLEGKCLVEIKYNDPKLKWFRIEID